MAAPFLFPEGFCFLAACYTVVGLSNFLIDTLGLKLLMVFVIAVKLEKSHGDAAVVHVAPPF